MNPFLFLGTNNLAVFKFLLVLSLGLSLGGCVVLVAGSVGVLGGYVVSPDTVEGFTSRDKEEVWDAAVEILSIMGTLKDRMEGAGRIRANIHGALVTVNIVRLSDAAVKMMVKARKWGFPRIRLAQEVYTKIMGYLHD